MTLEIRNFLIVSTAHVSEQTAKFLNNTPADEWPISGGPFSTYGWFMYTHDPELNTIEDLMPVFALARANGCNYVLFDCDASTVDQLPTFDW